VTVVTGAARVTAAADYTALIAAAIVRATTAAATAVKAAPRVTTSRGCQSCQIICSNCSIKTQQLQQL